MNQEMKIEMKQERPIYIGNAFSLSMVPGGGCFTVENISEAVARSYFVEGKSVVGHPDTAKVLGVAYNRESITLVPGDILIVAQLQGGRLPEGATELPAGFTFQFMRVKVME